MILVSEDWNSTGASMNQTLTGALFAHHTVFRGAVGMGPQAQ